MYENPDPSALLQDVHIIFKNGDGEREREREREGEGEGEGEGVEYFLLYVVPWARII